MPIPNDRLRQLRRQTGLKPGEFTALVKCSPAHLRGCENGWRQPSPELAARIARVLTENLGRKVSPHEFMGTPDRPPPQPRRPASPPRRQDKEQDKKGPKRVAA